MQHHKNLEDIEKELAEIQAAQENPARFGVLYDRYFKTIFIFIHRRTGDEALTADLTQQVFLKALSFIRHYQHKGVPFSAWLFRIALNEINMYFRKYKAGRTISLEENDVEELTGDSTDLYEKEERVTRLKKILSQLETGAIQLIELRFFEKRSFAEIGAILGITENNAKVKVYRVLDKMKLLFAGKK